VNQTSVLNNARVLDMTEALAGPFCTMMLGDFGADVIKIERPDTGDMTRGWAPPYVLSESAYFLSVNRNKRGITLNLKHPEAQAILHRLVETADVFIVNQPSLDSLRRMRADPDTLRAINPRLVYCAVSGFGMTGPSAGEAGYDIIAQGQAGLMTLTGEPGSGPIRYPIPLADATCGMYAAMGILAALLARESTGKGQFLDIALLDSQLAWLTHVAGAFWATGERPKKLGNAHATIVPYQPFRASDKYVMVAVGSDRLWQRFCQALDVADTLGKDPRFTVNPDRLRNRQVLIPMIEAIFAKRTAAEWIERLKAADIPCGPINEVDEALNDPQIQARGMIVTQEHATAGKIHSVGNPIHLSDTPATYRLPPPTLGQHTDEVLAELGWSQTDIARLHLEGAL
jgi:crotonobetainyl-CoA:carnitine CoA-transferase CaiB-like acyl-CoA transferase